jgi:hypothetical protein
MFKSEELYFRNLAVTLIGLCGLVSGTVAVDGSTVHEM